MTDWYDPDNCKSLDQFLLCEDSAVIDPLLDVVYSLLCSKPKKTTSTQYRTTKPNKVLVKAQDKTAFYLHLNTVLSNLVYQYDTNSPGCVFYSRTQKHYRKPGSQLNPNGMKLDMMLNVVDSLINNKLIWEEDGYNVSSGRGVSSRMKVAPPLLRLFKKYSFSHLNCSWHKDTRNVLINTKKTRIKKYTVKVDKVDSNGIPILDSNGFQIVEEKHKTKNVDYVELIEYQDCVYSDRYRKEMADYSKVLRNNIFKCFKGTNPKSLYGIPQSDYYKPVRIFRDNFKKGGRIYSSWHSKIKKSDRKNITFNGLPTTELDYKNNHIKIMMAAIAGVDDSRDAYELEGFKDKTGRDLLKLLLLSLLNTDSLDSAIRAMTFKISGSPSVRIINGYEKTRYKDLKSKKKFEAYCKNKNVDFKNLIHRFKERHPLIKDEFMQNQGLTLQRIDSDILMRTVNFFTSINKPILTMHDSIISLTSDSKLLRQKMIEYHKQVLNINKVNEDLLID
jgi:hypothetical protein